MKSKHPLTPSNYFSLLRLRSGQASKIQNPKPTLGVKGFTLIEIAVVLVILGVVFMSVLKIESMVKNAKIRQVISQYRELQTAILIYRDKYGYLPGDDPNAKTHVGARYNGNGNHIIEPYSSTYFEYHWVYEDLNRAGLIKGNFFNIGLDINSYPNPPLLHAFNKPIIVSYFTYGGVPTKAGNCIRFEFLPADVAQAIDTILDDGNPKTGFIRGLDSIGAVINSYTDLTGNGFYVLIFIE